MGRAAVDSSCVSTVHRPSVPTETSRQRKAGVQRGLCWSRKGPRGPELDNAHPLVTSCPNRALRADGRCLLSCPRWAFLRTEV